MVRPAAGGATRNRPLMSRGTVKVKRGSADLKTSPESAIDCDVGRSPLDGVTVEGLDGVSNPATEGGADESETLRGAEERRVARNAATGALAGEGDPLDVARFAELTASIDNALQELARAYSILHEIQSVENGATPQAGSTCSVNARLRLS